MSVPVYVDTFDGYKSSERPIRFYLDRQTYEIVAVESAWREPVGEFFQVRAIDGRRYLLRHVELEQEDVWTLQSDYDGDELLKRPDIALIVVGEETITTAEKYVDSCAYCDPDHADVPFNVIVAEVVGRMDNHDFFLSQLPLCPRCKVSIDEETLVVPRD